MAKYVKYNLDEMEKVKDNYQKQFNKFKTEWENIYGEISTITEENLGESFKAFDTITKLEDIRNDSFIEENEKIIESIEEKNTYTKNTIEELKEKVNFEISTINSWIDSSYSIDDYNYIKDHIKEYVASLSSYRDKINTLLPDLLKCSDDDVIRSIYEKYELAIAQINIFIAKYSS